MIHDFSPFLWRIHGDLGIRWYGLSYLTGFIVSYFLLRWLADRQRQGLTKEMIADFVTYGAIGILVGGRLGYCLFYSPDFFIKFRSEFPYWGVLAVNEGGMSSHGGMIGLVLATTWFAIKHGINRIYLYDLIAVCGPTGFFFGRLANFINGELVGRPAPENYPFAVKFPQDIFSWSNNPQQLGLLADVVQNLGQSREQWMEWVGKINISSDARAAIENTLFQIVESVQAGNLAVKQALGPLLVARYPSQLYAAMTEGLLLFVLLIVLWYKPRKPGVIGSTFVFGYAVVRIWDEQFRMPDAHLGYQLFDLTRGQWLSIAMAVLGLILLLIYGRRESLPIPGWGRGQSVKIGRRK